MNINSQNIDKPEEALRLANKDLFAFGKLFLGIVKLYLKEYNKWTK